ncbi:membrane protein DedA with SNARE-associated domain [Paenibacillus sp. JGP012]|uniref:DedA family protein n=1 Tax=Paenibacillus sp. JGP012 TaxID=2735914 RepID=UPI00161B4A0E|nr:DedA family protein [Paenibacillus sp. JGP012]MBB6024921.1 membrane protein DedA with SNARE-associated domain [Paenibacillus sp. JGP012]
MVINTILEFLHHYGYLFFFIAFSLGPFGVPIPNEITILTAAILSHSGVINSWLTYFCILLGLLTAVTLFYWAGKLFGPTLNKKLHKNKHYKQAENILNRNGNNAICIGMFIPVVRYFLPLLIGLSGVEYKKFALISYSSAIFWTILLFTLGTFFGEHLLSVLSF